MVTDPRVAPEVSTMSANDAGRAFPMRQMITNQKVRDTVRALVYFSPALIIFALFTYIPFFRALFLSLNVTDNAGEPARFNGINYYIRILGLDGRPQYMQSMLLSFQFALMVVPLSIIFGLGLAMLASVRLRFIHAFRTIFTSSISVSLASASVIWVLIFSPATKTTQWIVDLLRINAPSLLGSATTAMAAVAIVTIWSGLGFNFIITLAGVQAIPQDLYESASIDGANGWSSFRWITLPLLSPTLLFLAVVNTIGSLQAFTQFQVLFRGEGPEGATNVYTLLNFKEFWYDNRYGFASAMAIVLFVVLLLLTLFQYGVLNRRVHYS